LEQTTDAFDRQFVMSNTVSIVTSYLEKHDVATSILPHFIRDVFNTLRSLSLMEQSEPAETAMAAADPTRSLFPDYIVCLEDGEKMVSLKRHLMTAHKMTPDEYRAKWRLAPDYPMVAPNYAKRRSILAKQSGLGKVSNQRQSRKFA
jgi:predicted transcriptional regulator